MVYRAAVRATYDAALFIPGADGPSGRKHGHRYTVEAVLESNRTDEFGFVADFDNVQARLAAIAAELDHQLLNELDAFQDDTPSAERQAEYFYRRLSSAIEEVSTNGSVRLVRIRVTQEPEAWAEYEP